MKIVTWNVNSINARIEHLIKFIKKDKSDIYLIQELKCINDNFPIDAQNLALESMQNIYKSIIEKESSDIYDNYTSVHLLNMKSKIEIILDIDSSK